jgi:hypothetical protein
MIVESKLLWVPHVTKMWKTMNAYRNVVEKPAGKQRIWQEIDL